MCGRFVITSSPEAIRRLFGYLDQPNFPSRHNVAPTQPIPVVILESGQRRFSLMRWGLLPSWVKDPRDFSLVINARAETVLEKPAFRNAIKRRRCLVPADGYYEWLTAGSLKHPYFIHRADNAPFGFAALAETWVGPNGEEMDTVAIVTTQASEAMSALHHRVPVTIAPSDYERWLDASATDAEEATRMLVAPQDGEFVWHRVSKAVNRVANDSAGLIAPLSAKEMALEDEQAAAPKKKPANTSRVKPAKAATKATKAQGTLF